MDRKDADEIKNNKKNLKKKAALVGAGVATAGVAAYVGKKAYDKYKAKKQKEQEEKENKNK